MNLKPAGKFPRVRDKGAVPSLVMVMILVGPVRPWMLVPKLTDARAGLVSESYPSRRW